MLKISSCFDELTSFASRFHTLRGVVFPHEQPRDFPIPRCGVFAPDGDNHAVSPVLDIPFDLFHSADFLSHASGEDRRSERWLILPEPAGTCADRLEFHYECFHFCSFSYPMRFIVAARFMQSHGGRLQRLHWRCQADIFRSGQLMSRLESRLTSREYPLDIAGTLRESGLATRN